MGNMVGQRETLSIEQLQKIANEIRVDIIKMLEEAKSGHSAGPLGLSDIFTALYFDIMHYDPKNPQLPDRDILLLSNGHCVPVQYATMAHAGFFDRKELMTLRKHKSRLQGHPERHALPGLENTSGPLGCGLSQACGMALAMRMNKEKNRYIYVVMGDGELNEGNIWEAAMLAPKYNLNNIIGIVDRNNIQIDGNTEDVMPLGDLKKKWDAFGWNAVDIDGNNMEAVLDAINLAKTSKERPTVLIAHTVPGKGVDFMEGDYTWHGKPPNKEEAEKALDSLKEASK